MPSQHGLRIVLLASLLIAASAGCGSDDSGGGSTQSGAGSSGSGSSKFSELRIDPANPTERIAYQSEAKITFKVYATPWGEATEVPVDAAFSLSPPAMGTFEGGTLTVSGSEGATGTVTATYDGLTVRTTLTVVAHAAVVLDGLSPDLIDTVAKASADPELAPAWTYPEEGTVIPPNLYGVAWRWVPNSAANASLLQFRGGGNEVNVLTSQSTVTLPAAVWDLVVKLLGTGELTATNYGFNTADPTRAGTAVRTVRRSANPLKGALYYWASKGDHAPVEPNEDNTSARGYFRFDFNSVTSDKQSELFMGFNRAGDRCVGCHSVTRDGTRLATSFEGDQRWAVVDVATAGNPVSWSRGGPTDASALGNFNTFTPDGSVLLVTSGIQIRAFDVSTPGTHLIGSFDTPKPASHIAVSPTDGKTVIYVEDVTGGGGTNVRRGRIVRINWDSSSRQFTNRTVLLEDPVSSNYYPTISPDGQWILYSHVVADGAEASSLSNPAAEVWVMKLDGTGVPIRLTKANKDVNLSNSWPRWTPFATDDGEGNPRYFFTFSSVRAYGDVVNKPQLWLSTFNPANANSDSSTPAIWLPIQSLSLNNHAAQWAEVFVSN